MKEIGEEKAGRLEAYRLGALSPEEQRAFEQEVLEDPDLAAALYQAEGLDAALRRGAPARPAPRRLPRRLLWSLAAAAVVLLAVVPLLLPERGEGPLPAFRGSETELVALAPRGEVRRPRVAFRWSAVEGARRYRLEVFDAASRRLHQVVVGDTLTAVDVALLREAGLTEGFWRVTALGEVEAELAVSAPAPLRLAPDQ